MAFKSKISEIEDKEIKLETNYSHIGKSMVIEGEILSEENLNIEGKIKGNIKTNKKVFIGRDGYVEGDIISSIVEIIGRAKGKITAEEKIIIGNTGVFTGTLNSNKIVIKDGALFNGKSNMKKKIRLENILNNKNNNKKNIKQEEEIDNDGSD